MDFAVPRRFGLVYRDKDNTEKTPLCIHRAPLGTHERFIGFLIEHYAGNFPLWLAPEQVRVLTVGDEEALINYAKIIVQELRASMVRAEGDYSPDKIEDGGQTYRRTRRKCPRGDRRGDGVGGVVEAVGEIESNGDRYRDPQQNRGLMHS